MHFFGNHILTFPAFLLPQQIGTVPLKEGLEGSSHAQEDRR